MHTLGRGSAWLLILLAGCGGQMGPDRASGDPAGAPAAAQEDPLESIWREQKLIRNAEITIDVNSVEASITSINAIAARYDGVVADSETSRYSAGQLHASIRVRVPSAQFEAAMAELRGLGTVEREEVSTEDVTKAYYDLETRLAVKRESLNRLREILATRTGGLADVIAAETELARITSEIEIMEGDRRFYDHRIATSTIQISLTEPEGFVIDVFSPVRIGLREAARVFAFSVQSMIYLVAVAIPWGVVALVVLWFVRRSKRRAQPRTEA